MILFVSNLGESLPIALRLQKEGIEARVYIHNRAYGCNYDGIVEKVKIGELRKTINEAELVIFDTQKSNEKDKSDLALLKMFGLKKDSLFVFASIADKLRKDHNVIGIQVKDITPELAGLRVSKKKIEGVRVCVEGWFDGEKFVFYDYILKNTRFLTGDLGVDLRSQTNLVWVQSDTFLRENFKKLVPALREVKYRGSIGIDVVVSSRNKKPYCLGITQGFRFDAFYCLLSLVKSPLSEFFGNNFNVEFLQDYAASERVTIPPFPYSEKSLLDNFAKGVEVNFNGANTFWGQDIKKEDRKFRVVGADGIVGTVAVRGKSVEKAFSGVYRAIHKLKVDAPLQYRIDGTKQMEKKINKLSEWGYKLKEV